MENPSTGDTQVLLLYIALRDDFAIGAVVIRNRRGAIVGATAQKIQADVDKLKEKQKRQIWEVKEAT